MHKFTKKEIENYKYYTSKEEAKKCKTINSNNIYNLNIEFKESLAKAESIARGEARFVRKEDEEFFWKKIEKLNSQILYLEKENDLIFKAYSI